MIFVDTGAWITQFSKRDQYYRVGVERFGRLQKENTPLATSAPVLYETITFLTRDLGVATGIKAGKQIASWKRLLIIRPSHEDERAALDIMERFADHPIGFVDCLSFALMRRERISTAFTFDRHFESAGFSIFGNEMSGA
jgi:predicted nucleic acid-binding protein